LGPMSWAKKAVICAGLVGIIWILFGRAVLFPFINYDDPSYILERPEVVRGVSWPGIVWSFTHVHSGNWHPLTSISHMLDCQIFGLNAGGHHFVNVLLHTVSAVLLFLIWQKMTGNYWASAFVAAVFAIQPLRVESVVWIAERKDVLSGLFFMLTIGAYLRFVKQPSAFRYIAMSILFVLGLMSKPMLVTLPMVLLLLDYWPLQRRASIRNLLLEKIPLFLLSVASSIATMIAQHESVSSLDRLPLVDRLSNAVISYVVYLRQTFWPTDLAPIYPLRPNQFTLSQIAGALALLATISVVAWRLRRSRPYLLVGWLWYLVMLVPVIGIVQVGFQAHADRYTYLPQIGLCIAVAWGAADLTRRLCYQRFIVASAAVVVLGAFAATTFGQLRYWRDPEVLWKHTIDVTGDNDIAHAHLADFLMRNGRVAESISHSQEAVRIRPNNADAQNNLGLALLQSGDERDAALHFELSLRADATNLNARVNLAWILATSADQSVRNGARAVELAESVARGSGRDNPIVLRTLAASFAEAGRFAEAIETADNALQLARSANNEGLVVDLERSIASYRLNEPLRSRAP
jgi:cytochrome c-type biogenesis protein CcmH/NrfG